MSIIIQNKITLHISLVQCKKNQFGTYIITMYKEEPQK